MIKASNIHVCMLEDILLLYICIVVELLQPASELFSFLCVSLLNYSACVHVHVLYVYTHTRKRRYRDLFTPLSRKLENQKCAIDKCLNLIVNSKHLWSGWGEKSDICICCITPVSLDSANTLASELLWDCVTIPKSTHFQETHSQI